MVQHKSVEVSADLSGLVFQQDVDSPTPGDQTLSLFGEEVHSASGRIPIPAQHPSTYFTLDYYFTRGVGSPFPIPTPCHGYPQRTSL